MKTWRLTSGHGGGQFSPPEVPPGSNDLYFDKVLTLLHFNTNPYADVKGNTVNATSTTLASDSKFGGGCVDFGGNGYIDLPALPASPGTGDFTVEFWIKTTTPSTGGVQAIVSSPARWSDPSLFRIWQNDTGADFGVVNAIQLSRPDGTGKLVDTKTVVTDGLWHHIAFTRQAGTLRAFFDGKLMDTLAGNADYFSSISGDGIRLGAGFNSGSPVRYTNAKMDDFRFTIGVARYTADFIPPTSAFADSGPTPAPDTRKYTLRGITGLTRIVQSYADDANAYIEGLGFDFMFQGLNLNQIRVSPVSNSYITFQSVATDYSNLGPATPALKKLHVGAADRSWFGLWVGLVDNGDAYTIRWVGNQTNSNVSSNIDDSDHLWEVTFYKDGSIVLVTKRINGSPSAPMANSVTGIASSSSWLAQIPNLAPNSAYLFLPSDANGNTWSVTKKA